MNTTSIESLAALLGVAKDLTLTGGMIIFIVGLVRQWWVIGHEHRRVLRELEEWKALALTSTGLADKSVENLHTAIHIARDSGRPSVTVSRRHNSKERPGHDDQ